MKIDKAPEKINTELRTLCVALKELHEDPKNARKHSDRNLAAIASSLARYGQQKPIVVRPDGEVIAGNGTFRAAKAMGWKRLARVVFDGDASQAAEYGIADNRTGELAEWDDVILAQALKEMAAATDGDLGFLGFTDEEFMAVVGRVEQEIADAVADAGPVSDGSEPTASPSDAPESNVRLVQLFLTDETQPQIVEWLKDLAVRYGTTNITDTVFEAVRRQHGIDAAAAAAE